MTYVETLRQEGRPEGRQEIVANMLHSGFKPEEVAKCIGIPLQVVKMMEKKS